MKRRIPLGGRLALVLSALLPLAAGAQPASLVRDINITPEVLPFPPDPNFQSLVSTGNRLYFSALGEGAGSEIWVSDGTSTGTALLRDSCPGPCAGTTTLRAVNGLLYFTQALDSFHQQLWRTAGTRAGTFALTGGEPDVSVATLRRVETEFRGAYYFAACTSTGAGDCDLWRTDGTAAGTARFHTAPNLFYWAVPVGNRLYYLASNGIARDLWVTDGTAAGTRLLRSFAGGGRTPDAAVAAGGRLFFFGSGSGEELWTSDGTAAGTVALTSLSLPNPFPATLWLKAAGSRVYFTANDGQGRELWRSDGTRNGTVRLTNFAEAEPFNDSLDASFLAVLGTTPVFWAKEGGQTRLWANPGGPGSAVPLLPSCTDCSPTPDDPIVESGGKAYFALRRAIGSEELWVTNGTVAGTTRLVDRCTSEGCTFSALQPWKGGLLFVLGFDFYDEAWSSDGTAAGTRRWATLPGSEGDLDGFQPVELGGRAYFLGRTTGTAGLWRREERSQASLVASTPLGGPSSNPRLVGAAGERLLFTARENSEADSLAWLSGGTAATTQPLEPINALGELIEPPFRAVRIGPLLYFQTAKFTGGPPSLWRSDGTPAGTFVVAHLQASAPMAAWQGGLTFFDGGWIWRTDGTVAGTVKTGDIPAGLVQIDEVATGPNGVYIKGVSAPGSSQFWFSDGTGGGTRELTEFPQNGVSAWEARFTTVGSWVYFSWLDGLWKTNGSRAGTVRVQSLPSFELPVRLAEFQGSLVYLTAANDSTVGAHLWRTQGTEASTVLLGSYPGDSLVADEDFRLVPFGGKLYFNLDDGTHGKELMATDGTPAGTGLAVDLVPGRSGSAPSGLTAANGRLYFAAGDSQHGHELWASDGTPGGTRLVHDIAPQAGSSSPEQLTVAGGQLYFSADDGVTGRELWVLPLGAPSACVPSATRLCLNGGRYAVEAAWRTPSGAIGAGHTLPLAGDTGAFWFFSPSNVEAVIKVLDGRGVNGHIWTFYGALSDVEYSLTVTDTETGLTHRYRNPQGTLASVADVQSFGPNGANATVGSLVSDGVRAAAPLRLADRRVVARAATGSCAPASTRLCLNGGRYSVEVAWKDFTGNTGAGQAVGLTGDTGYFWFFDAANVELVLKVLDGTAVNGHRWIFYGALSSVEYTVTVTDTETGEVATYRNPSGNLASVADTAAF